MKINEEIKNEYPWGPGREWKTRTMLIASIIPDGSRVIELGGGFCHLEKYLKNSDYTSLDLKAWTDKTIKADFNNGKFPDIKPEFQIVVAQGILEYIDDPETFLKTAKKYGKILILSYLAGVRCDVEQRKNRITWIELKELIERAGWKIAFQRGFSPRQKLYYCTQS